MIDVEDPSPRRRRAGGRSARVKKAVYEATLWLLVDAGWQNLSVAMIAARAGVHETSIYRRWKSKEAIVINALLEHTGEQLPVPDTGSLQGDLIALMRGALAFLRSPLGGALVRMSVALPSGEEATALRRAFWARRFPVVEAVLEHGAERGEIAPDLDRQLFLEMLFGVFHFRIFVIDDSHDDDLPERVAQFLLGRATM